MYPQKFVNIKYLRSPEFNIRFGRPLAPFGFLIEIVEPPHHLGNRRQEVETQIIPGT